MSRDKAVAIIGESNWNELMELGQRVVDDGGGQPADALWDIFVTVQETSGVEISIHTSEPDWEQKEELVWSEIRKAFEGLVD